MSLMSSSIAMDFMYAPKDCFHAMKDAVEALPKFSIQNENELAGMIQIDVKAGMTSLTFGDIVTATFVANPDGGTKVCIESTAKVPSLLASVQQNKNIQATVDALTAALKNYSEVSPAPANPEPNAVSTSTLKARMEALNELHATGLISDAEYEQKRAELMSSI